MDKNYHKIFCLEDLDGEEWRGVNGYKGSYEISNLGRVKSLSRQYRLNAHSSIIMHETIKKMMISNCNYLMVVLSYKKKKKCPKLVHRLVAEAFIPNPTNLREVNHINGIKWDNRAENLQWMSSSENKLHAYKKGLQVAKFGENHNRAKLKEADVLRIRALRMEGKSQYSLAKEYNVTLGCIQSIVHHRTWKHLLKAV